MALIICPECQKQISSHAAACPHCGYPLNSDLGAAAPLQEPPQKKFKKKRIVLLSILACLILGVAGCLGYILFAPETKQVEAIKDENYLYKWMTEHGTVTGGTVLEYYDYNDTGRYTLIYDPSRPEQCRWYIDYSGKTGLFSHSISYAALFPKDDTATTLLTVSDQYNETTGIEFSYTPSTFTRNSPVVYERFTSGSTYYVNRCKIHAQRDLRTVLDWLQNSFCPAAGMTMADFGYPMYK